MKIFLYAMFFILSLLSVSIGPVSAQESKSTDAPKIQTPIQIRPIESSLPNGLKLIVVEDKLAAQVQYSLGFQTSVVETSNIETPLLYQMINKLVLTGSSTLKAEQLKAELKKLNASMSTHNSADYLIFSGHVPLINNKAFVKLLADAVINASFSEENLQQAKIAVKASVAEFLSKALAPSKAREALFGTGPYTYPTSNHLNMADKITLETLISLYKKTFAPNNAVLVVVGNVKADETKNIANEFFGNWFGDPSLTQKAYAPKMRGENSLYLIDSTDVKEHSFYISFAGPPVANQDYLPMVMLYNILASNGGKIFLPQRYVSLFTIGNTLTGSNIKDAIDSALLKIESLKSKPISDIELNQSKALLINENSLLTTPSNHIANKITEAYLLGHPSDYIQTLNGKINAITAMDIQRVAKQYFDTNKAAIVVMGNAPALLDQLKPFAKNIEIFDTKGNKKEMTTASTNNMTSASADNFEGVWNLTIDFQGSPVKATLELKKQETVYKGTVKTDLGDGQMTDAAANGNAIDGTISLNMYGQNIEIKFKGVVDKDAIKGMLTPNFQGVRELPFTGTRAK